MKRCIIIPVVFRQGIGYVGGELCVPVFLFFSFLFLFFFLFSPSIMDSLFERLISFLYILSFTAEPPVKSESICV